MISSHRISPYPFAIFCYADKFYSKSHLDHEKTIEQAMQSLAKFGAAGVERFRRWVTMFE